MTNEDRQRVIASCPDLMLARGCVSDLQAAGFKGTISVRPWEPADVLRGATLQAYGDPVGESAGRGILVGAFLGLAAGVVVSSAIGAAVESVPVVVLAVTLGAALGGIVRWRSARLSPALRREREHHGRFVLCCDGSSDEIATAFQALHSSPCINLQVYEGCVEAPNLVTAREAEAPVA
jgi:hypothetical protein